MRLSSLALLVLASSCATAPPAQPEHPPKVITPDVAAREKLEARLSALPACPAGARPAVLVLSPTRCTKQVCQTPCCNTCGWSAASGADAASVRSVLQLEQGAQDCEIAMWSEVLSKRPLDVAAGCVER